MDTGGLSPVNIGTNVWLSSPRTLTSLGSGSMVLIGVAQSSLAASTSLDLRPVAGKFREISVGLIAGAAGAVQFRIFDGTHAIQIVTVAANNTGGGSTSGNSTAGPQLSNADATNAASYIYGGVDWTQ